VEACFPLFLLFLLFLVLPLSSPSPPLLPTCPIHQQDEALILAAICSNRANVDDAIDSAVFRAMKKSFGEAWEERMHEYEVTKFVGFNPEFKRTVVYANR